MKRSPSFSSLIALLVVLAIVLRVWLIFVTPPDVNVPDEYLHLSYMTFISTVWYPFMRFPIENYEFAQPPIYYFIAAFIYRSLSYFGSSIGFYSLRFFSMVCSVLSLIVGYKAIQLITKNKLTLLSSLLFMGFTPKIAQMSIGINNDQFSWVFSTVAIYLIVRSITEKSRPATTGLWVGAAVATKMVTLPLVVGGILSSLFVGQHFAKVGDRVFHVLKYVLVLSVIISLVIFWNISSYGAVIPQSIQLGSMVEPQDKLYRFLFPNLADLHSFQATPDTVRYAWQAQLQPNILWGNLVTMFSFWLDSRMVSGWPDGIMNWLVFWGMVISSATFVVMLGAYSVTKKTSTTERKIAWVFLSMMIFYILELNLFSYVVWQTVNGRELYSAIPIVAFFFGSGVNTMYEKVSVVLLRIISM